MYVDNREMYNLAFSIEGTGSRACLAGGGLGMKKRLFMRLNGAYTVEAAGVMSAVLLTILVLLSSAFQIHREILAVMRLHTSVERERHAVSSVDEDEVSMEVNTGNGMLVISAPVFRPENSLRMWSLLEGER